jgi:hypothetical protein
MQQGHHAILTASDANCGDFLATHWLRSLRDNVDLKDVDVVVLDFGLAPHQREALEGVELVAAERGFSVNVSRRNAVARFLEARDYDQVLVVDAGDLIFQGDVGHLLRDARESFRGVPERFPIPLPLLMRGTRSDLRRSIQERLRGRPMVNGGFLLGPASKLRELGRAVQVHADSTVHDQPLVSSFLHEWGFEALDDSYNFIPWTARRGFRVEDGAFFTDDGQMPRVVHNTGIKAPFRVIADFGYGPGCNRRIRRRYLRLASAYGRARSLVGAARPERN